MKNIPPEGCNPCPKGCLNCPFVTCEYNGYAGKEETQIVREIIKDGRNKNAASVYDRIYCVSVEFPEAQWR